MRSRHIRNTEGVKKHAQMKSQETAQKVDQAIQRLIKTKAKIIFKIKLRWNQVYLKHFSITIKKYGTE